MKNFSFGMFALLLLGSNFCKAQEKDFTEFLPEGYIIYERVFGDLNKDGVDDCVLIIKGTFDYNLVQTDRGAELDLNRRGILVLFNKNDKYELISKNIECFSSESEDMNDYTPAELTINMGDGNLHLNFNSSYGYWEFIFRYENKDFELIGYETDDSDGTIVSTQTRIDFLTNKKIIRENINEKAEGGDEVYKETSETIEQESLLKLSEIEDFDQLEMP